MNPWLRVFLPFALGYFLSYLLRNTNAVIAPELTRELALGAADLGLLTSAYLLTFGLFQLPLGLLLDRYGPRRVEAILLLIAAAGCAVFAGGTAMTQLTAGRALIGLGVSACLMASFKAFSIHFPIQRLPSLNAAVMAAGGLGALAATTPLALALPQFGWRGIFFALCALALLAAAGIWSTPERPVAGQDESLRAQLRGLADILKSRVFWRFAPQTAMIVGGFMAIQGLWAVPWLIQVNGATQAGAAFHLLLMSGAQLAGFLAIAFLVEPLRARGVTPEQILRFGMGAGLVVLALIVADIGVTHLLWGAMGFVFSVGNLAYALLAARFPPAMSGRVNTALNLGAFVGAFGMQWGIGVMVDLFLGLGWTPVAAYRGAFGILLVLQTAGHLWFVIGKRQDNPNNGDTP